MKRGAVILIGTHVVAIGAGVVMAWAMRDGEQEAGPGARPARVVAAAAPGGDRAPQATRSGDFARGAKRFRAADYAAAWKALPRQDLTMAQRIEVQMQLLRQWAEVDLEGALEAALAEAADSGGSPFYSPGSHPLLRSFDEAFRHRPLDAWELIASKRFGLATALVRKQWIDSVGTADPALAISFLNELPARERVSLVQRCSQGATRDPQTRDAFYRKLADLPASEETDRLRSVAVRWFSANESPDEIKAKAVAEAHPGMRAMRWQAYGATVANLEADRLRDEIASLPEDVRGTAATAMLDSNRGTSGLLPILDTLMENGAWKAAGSESAQNRIRALGSKGENLEDLAAWAVALPDREESIELFHRATEHYMKANMEEAREWILAFPPGWKRERAFAEYSQAALQGHADLETSRWALDQIADPKLKTAAEGWRRSWEQSPRP